MSSHHVVREHQEPALLLWEAKNIAMEVVFQLLEWSPVVATHLQALDLLIHAGIKVDVVFCSTEELDEAKERLAEQHPVKLIAVHGLSVYDALFYLQKEGAAGVNICTTINNETIEILEKEALLLKMVLFNDTHSFFPLKGYFEKWLPSSAEVLIQSIGTVELTTNGFMTDCNREGFTGNSQLIVAKDGIVSLMVEKGVLWVGESLT